MRILCEDLFADVAEILIELRQERRVVFLELAAGDHAVLVRAGGVDEER